MSKEPTSAEIAWMDREYERLAPLLDRYVKQREVETAGEQEQLQRAVYLEGRKNKALEALNRISEGVGDHAPLPTRQSWFWRNIIEILYYLIVK